MAPSFKSKKVAPVRRTRLALKIAQSRCVAAQATFSLVKEALDQAHEDFRRAGCALAEARTAGWEGSYEKNSKRSWELSEVPYTMGEVQRKVEVTEMVLCHLRRILHAEPTEGISESCMKALRDSVQSLD